jgi:hypothetical protein
MAFLLTGIPVTVASHVYSLGLTMTKNTGILAMSMTLSVITSYFLAIFRYNENINFLAIIGSISIIIGIAIAIFLKTP